MLDSKIQFAKIPEKSSQSMDTPSHLQEALFTVQTMLDRVKNNVAN